MLFGLQFGKWVNISQLTSGRWWNSNWRNLSIQTDWSNGPCCCTKNKQHKQSKFKNWNKLKSLGIQSPCQMMIGVSNHLRNARYLGSITILRRWARICRELANKNYSSDNWKLENAIAFLNWSVFFQLSNEKRASGCLVYRDEILPSFCWGIIVRYYFWIPIDQPGWLMECRAGFFDPAFQPPRSCGRPSARCLHGSVKQRTGDGRRVAT